MTFPRKPEECKRHRWLPIIEVKSGEQTGGLGCWFCGADKSKVDALAANPPAATEERE